MNDRPALSRQVGAVVFARVFVSLIDSFKSLLLARILSKADFGVLSFALTVHGTATGLGVLAMPDSLLYFLPRHDPPTQRSLVRQSLAFLAVTGVLAALAVAVMALVPVLRPVSVGTDFAALLWIAGAVAFDMPSGVLTTSLLATGRHRTASLVSMALSGGASLGLLIPALFGATSVPLAAAFCGLSGLRLAATWLVYRRVFATVPAAPFTGGLRAQLEYALPLSLNKYFSTYVAGLLLVSQDFADAALGGQELPFVTMLPYAVAVALLPHMSLAVAQGPTALEGGRKALKLWHDGIEKVALVMLALFVASLIEADSVIAILYGKQYAAAALPFRITALLLAIRVTAYGTLLLALGQTRAILRSQLWGLAVNLLANGLLFAAVKLAPAEWVPGVTMRIAVTTAASVAAQLVGIGVMLAAIADHLQVGWRGVFPWRGYLQRLGVAVLAGVPMAAWSWLQPPTESVVSAMALVARLLVFAGLCIGLAHVTGLLTAEDRAVLGQWIRLEPLRKGRD
jgi:O-antigen/teichoic acid export membrane protein